MNDWMNADKQKTETSFIFLFECLTTWLSEREREGPWKVKEHLLLTIHWENIDIGTDEMTDTEQISATNDFLLLLLIRTYTYRWSTSFRFSSWVDWHWLVSASTSFYDRKLETSFIYLISPIYRSRRSKSAYSPLSFSVSSYFSLDCSAYVEHGANRGIVSFS